MVMVDNPFIWRGYTEDKCRNKGRSSCELSGIRGGVQGPFHLTLLLKGYCFIFDVGRKAVAMMTPSS